MIDKRLIDYSNQYRDYYKTLEEKGRSLNVQEVLTLIEGFLAVSEADFPYHREKEVVKGLKKVHMEYHKEQRIRV
ncbi:MAG: hypothetical protein AAF462_08950 [Thermodesulfobacteriota bacterium]